MTVALRQQACQNRSESSRPECEQARLRNQKLYTYTPAAPYFLTTLSYMSSTRGVYMYSFWLWIAGGVLDDGPFAGELAGPAMMSPLPEKPLLATLWLMSSVPATQLSMIAAASAACSAACSSA